MIRSSRAAWWAACFMALAGGCQHAGPFEPWVHVPPLDSHMLQERSGAADVAGAAIAVKLPADATVGDYIHLAWERNPAIAAATQRVAAARERISQATSLEDPMFMVTPLGEGPETAAGEVGLMTSISQRFPGPGKLHSRRMIAEAEAAQARWQLQEAKLELAGRVEQAYWNWYAAVRSLEVLDQTIELTQQMQQAAQSAYAAGSVGQEDVLRPTIERVRIETEQTQLSQRVASLRGQLNALIDRPVLAPLPEPAPVEISADIEPFDDLLAQANANHPQLQSLRLTAQARWHQLRLARLDRVPDLTVELAYADVEDEGLAMSANGDDQWSLGFAINLPIWTGRLDAAEREARRSLLATLADLHAARNNIAANLQDALARMQAQQRIVQLLEGALLPQSQQAFEAALAGYRNGRSSMTDVLQNWTNIIALRQLVHQSVAQFQQADADVALWTGRYVMRDESPLSEPAKELGPASAHPTSQGSVPYE